jgi:hypothetical protein
MTTTETTPRIFLTDYASYNNGTQFEFGHWLDLADFSDADELIQYINNHFAEADKKSPLDSPREEIMITDFEGFPESLYSEAMSKKDFEKIYLLIDWMNDNGLDSLENEGDNLLSAWNDYCSENNADDQIFDFDDDTLQMLFGDDPMKVFQAGVNAQINWSDNYLYFDGYANMHSTNDPSNHIDETVLVDWILENL